MIKVGKVDNAVLAPCGVHCEMQCPYFIGALTPRCAGCGIHKGHPFWGECKTYACATEHGVEHCGICPEFPCDSFIETFDPNDPEGQRSAVLHAGFLAYRKRHGSGKYADLVRKLEKGKARPP